MVPLARCFPCGRGWSDKRLVRVAFVLGPLLFFPFFPGVFNKCHADT